MTDKNLQQARQLERSLFQVAEQYKMLLDNIELMKAGKDITDEVYEEVVVKCLIIGLTLSKSTYSVEGEVIKLIKEIATVLDIEVSL